MSQTHIMKFTFAFKEMTLMPCFDVLTSLIAINVHVSDMFIFWKSGMTLACGCGALREVSLFPVYHIFHVNVKQFT